MNKSKGFVFVETIVVVAVLTISLLMLYTSYSSLINKEKERLKYDDSAYLFRTYYLKKFFKNFRLDLVEDTLSDNNNILITSFGCNADVFLKEEDNIAFCQNLLSELNVSNLYFAYNDLSDLQNCTNTSGKCESLLQINDRAASYIKTVGGKGKTGYRIIVEFSENKDGTFCEEGTCINYYSSLDLGDIR